MKRSILLAALLAAVPVLSVASGKNEQKADFTLQVHIVRVDMGQGEKSVSGSGSTDSNGNYTSHVSGGGSYLYHVYTVHIDGDNRELTMTTPVEHYKGGRALAIATLGYNARPNASLHLGDYKGHWNSDGSLEIQFINEKGEPKHQPFFIRAESPLNAEH